MSDHPEFAIKLAGAERWRDWYDRFALALDRAVNNDSREVGFLRRLYYEDIEVRCGVVANEVNISVFDTKGTLPGTMVPRHSVRWDGDDAEGPEVAGGRRGHTHSSYPKKPNLPSSSASTRTRQDR